jgi:hypothetical protein
MEVALALLADAANQTDTKKLNVLGVFGNINAPVLPYRHPTMTLVLKFTVDPVEADTDKTIRVVLVDPDGRELNRIEIQAHLPLAENRGVPMELVMNLGMNGVEFEKGGPHAFVVLVNGETKTRVPLSVTAPNDMLAKENHDDNALG